MIVVGTMTTIKTLKELFWRQQTNNNNSSLSNYLHNHYFFGTQAMRSEDGEIADVMCRAPYGTAEIDSIKLQECNSCDHLLRYCNVSCQEDHAPQHEQDYKRAAEKRDDILYRQPESSHLGDCPISK
eukprot:scaffold12702_cov119-Skeletonema_dohrnii-CCMP3373.AAC.6